MEPYNEPSSGANWPDDPPAEPEPLGVDDDPSVLMFNPDAFARWYAAELAEIDRVEAKRAGRP
ncbi:MAG: hypothetical protein ACLP1X_05735 [Polyangiaceae bacterium]